MPGTEAKCIYCDTPFDPNLGEGDHVIPSLLGEFAGDVRFHGICRICNSTIGKSEQQFARSAPPGFFRHLVAPRSKRNVKRGVGRMGRAAGAPSPEFFVDMGDHLALVEQIGPDPRDVQRVDHVVVTDKCGNISRQRLYPNLPAEKLANRVAKDGVGEMKTVYLHAGEETYESYMALVMRVWPGSKVEHGPTTEQGEHQMAGQAKFTFNDHTYRAIAKIAFHYYLVHSSRHTGREEFFAPARDFILNGGDSDQFFYKPDGTTFATPATELPDGGVYTPASWCHVLGASEASDEAVVFVQLFLGPGCIPAPHYVVLGRWTSPIATPNAVWGHVYHYEDYRADGRAGRVEAVIPERIT